MRYIFVSTSVPEWIACVLLLILLTFSLLERSYTMLRTKVFRASILLSLSAILSNILTITIWPHASALPAEFVYGANMMYFIVFPLAEVFLCVYVLTEIYSKAEQKPAFLINIAILGLLYISFLLLVFTNRYTGFLFVLDSQNNYARGNGSWTNVALMDACMIVLISNYIGNIHQVSGAFRGVFFTMPLVAGIMGLLQLLSMDLQLSGTVLALTTLMFFITCQRQQASTDQLTGVGNRFALFSRLEKLIRQHHEFTLQMITLRGFHRINRRLGLHAGDELICKAGRSMQQICPDDQCFRTGGTEFVILHIHAPNADSAAQLLKVQELFREPFRQKQASIRLDASFAEVSYPISGTSAEEVMTALEYCMHKAQEGTAGHLVIYNSNIRRDIEVNDRITEMIHNGLRENLFYMVYQPIYDAAQKKPCAAEALIRMKDTNGDTVRPDLFIPIAEENGLIVPITWMVLDKVCSFISTHRDSGLPPISINFSAQQFLEQDMIVQILDRLKKYRIAPEQIRVEITERVLLASDSLVARNIRMLTENGIKIYLDDFGTGYSNMASVMHLPIDVVKIDKSVIPETPNDKSDRLLQSMIYGLKGIGCKVLAEGIETEEQLDRLCGMQIDRIQGFYFSRPLEEQPFLRHMKEHQA